MSVSPSVSEAQGARLVRRTDAGAGLVLLAFDVSEEIAATYTECGQYCEVALAGDVAFFALAGQVGEAPWEILVRHAGGASEGLLAMSVGEVALVSAARGHGFPVGLARDRELVVVVTGSAVGAVRALLDARTAVAAPITHLYLGVRDATDPPLPDALARWARNGAHVTLCASSNGDPHDGLDVRVGYAQRVCAADLAAGLAPAGVIFAAGHEEIFADLEGPRGERPLYGNV